MINIGNTISLAGSPNKTEYLINSAVKAVKELGLANTGELVAITAGVRTGIPGSTDLLLVSEIE